MKTLCTLLLVSACAVAALAKSECESHRERELATDTVAKLVPRCKSNGDYEAKQCFEGSEYCMCWRPDGSTVTGPTRKLKSCECHLINDYELKQSELGMVGNFVPSCETDGTYSRRQCHGSTGYCWCANEKGERTSEESRDEINC